MLTPKGFKTPKKDQFMFPQKRNTSMTTTSRIKNFTRNFKPPKEGDKIVYIAGAWDILHAGHVRQLRKAKTFGDFLIVGIYGDETIN